METMITEIYGNDMHKLSSKRLSELAILASTNKEVLQMNNAIIDSLPGVEVTYLSVDDLITPDQNDIVNFPAEFLNKRTPSGMPPHEIKLKVGVIVMLLRNIRPLHGLSNGTRLQVTRLAANAIEAEIISETCRGDIVYLFRMDLTANDNSLPCTMRRSQFPIIPAYAMTINKSQGQTLDKVGIFLSSPVFAHGQLYVALSRCRNGRNIKVHCSPCTNAQGDLLGTGAIYTLNVVYREVFVHNEMKTVTPLDLLSLSWQDCINNLEDDEELMGLADDEMMEPEVDEAFLPEFIQQFIAEFPEPAAQEEVNRLINEVVAAHSDVAMDEPQQPADQPQQPDIDAFDEAFDENYDDQFFEENFVEENEEQFLEAMEAAVDEPDFHEFVDETDVGDQGEVDEPVNIEAGTGERLLIFKNRLHLFSNEELFNMCPHNSLVHGFVYLFKRDPAVRTWMEQQAKDSQYFATVVNLIGDPSDGNRNAIWGQFIRATCGDRLNNGDALNLNMAADVTEVVNWCIDNHSSFEIARHDGPRDYVSVMLRKNDRNGQPLVPQFPHAITTTFGVPRGSIVFRDVLLISLDPDRMEWALNELQSYFDHAGDRFTLKFVVRFLPEHYHYKCYAHDTPSATWLELDDCAARERPFHDVKQKMQVRLLMYTRL